MAGSGPHEPLRAVFRPSAPLLWRSGASACRSGSLRDTSLSQVLRGPRQRHTPSVLPGAEHVARAGAHWSGYQKQNFSDFTNHSHTSTCDTNRRQIGTSCAPEPYRSPLYRGPSFVSLTHHPPPYPQAHACNTRRASKQADLYTPKLDHDGMGGLLPGRSGSRRSRADGHGSTRAVKGRHLKIPSRERDTMRSRAHRSRKLRCAHSNPPTLTHAPIPSAR